MAVEQLDGVDVDRREYSEQPKAASEDISSGLNAHHDLVEEHQDDEIDDNDERDEARDAGTAVTVSVEFEIETAEIEDLAGLIADLEAIVNGEEW